MKKYTITSKLLSKEWNINPESLNDISSISKTPQQELESFIGLSIVKTRLKEIISVEKVKKTRNIQVTSNSHMIFQGSPGTGKTEIARIVGRLLKENHILSSGHIVNASLAEVKKGYVGQTTTAFKEKCEEAIGGILFIDEIYLFNDGNFGKQALEEVLVPFMEDNRGEIIVIGAGYSNQINDLFNINPGLKGRFPIIVDFPDYVPDELIQIADIFIKSLKLEFNDDAKKHLHEYLTNLYENRDENWANARTVRNVIEDIFRRWASRCDENNLDVNIEKVIEIDLPEIKEIKQKVIFKQEISTLRVFSDSDLDIKDELDEKWLKSVFLLDIETNENSKGYGTAFLTDKENGILFTAAHNVIRMKSFKISIPKHEITYPCECVFINEYLDFAVLKLKPDLISHLHDFSIVSSDEHIKTQDEILVIGFPLGKGVAPTPGSYNGEITNLNNSIPAGSKAFQINADVTHGLSGAPVVHIKSGKVLGILHGGIVTKDTHAASFNLAVDIRQIYSLENLTVKINE